MKIVLWKLGSLEHKIFPTNAAIAKLKNMIADLRKDEQNDIIWGPDIDIEVVEVEDVDQFILAYKKEESNETNFDCCGVDNCPCNG